MCDHNWILKDSRPVIYWDYPLRKKIFRNSYWIDDRFYRGDLKVYSRIHEWYCTKCREFSSTCEEVRKVKPIPGRALWWNKHKVWIVPKEVFHLTERAMNLNPTGNLQEGEEDD